MMKSKNLSCLVLLLITFLSGIASGGNGKLKVFLLAGQSNMEGKATAGTLDAVLGNPKMSKPYKHLKKNGKWVVRDDVWVTFLCKPEKGSAHPLYGPLTVGFGGAKTIRTADRKKIPALTLGPELGFGHVIGNHFDEPVLLIKAAWGGQAIKRTFRPPSAMPGEQELKDALASTQRKNPNYTMKECKASFGVKYREMIAQVELVLGDIKKYVPDYESAKGYEIAGMVWFQGWNDGVGGGNPKYTDQLACLIRDVRKDLKTPALPVVIGEIGTDGPNIEGGWIKTLRNQQAAVADIPEFKGNVSFARTAQYWPTYPDNSKKWDAFRAASKVNAAKPESDPTRMKPGDFFQKNWAQKYKKELAYSSDKRYHYKGSAACYYQMGESMGKAMLEIAN